MVARLRWAGAHNKLNRNITFQYKLLYVLVFVSVCDNASVSSQSYIARSDDDRSAFSHSSATVYVTVYNEYL